MRKWTETKEDQSVQPKVKTTSPPPALELWTARASLCLLLCTIVYLFAGAAFYHFWHPDLAALSRELGALTIIPPKIGHPEPVEKRFFLFVILTVPFLILGSWQFVSGGKIGRLIAEEADAVLFVATAAFVALGITALAARNPEQFPAVANTFSAASLVNAGFYFYGTFVYYYFYLYALLIFPLSFFLLTSQGARRFLAEKKSKVEIGILSLAAGMGLWMLVETAFRFPNNDTRYDLSAVFYPVVQVFHGSQLLTDHFVDNYGLYPEILLPFFKLIGLNFLTFSGTMAVLSVICFGLLLMVLWRLIANRLILLWTFAAVLFYVYCYSRTIAGHNPYFANIPIRLIFPMAALGLSLRYRRGTSRPWTIAVLSFLGIGVLWSPDFGLMTYCAFTLYLGYLRVDPAQPRRTALALGEVLVLSLGTLALLALGYTGLMRLLYGTIPDLSLLFSTLKLYSVLGVAMMPMPLIHPWNLLALTLGGGLLATLPQLLRGEQEERSATLFLLTLLGIGTFSYYQGRSHNWNLLLIEIYAIALWGIFCDRLLNRVEGSRWLYAPLAVLVFILATSLPQLVYASPKLAKLIDDSDNRLTDLPIQEKMERNAAFIERGTVPGEKVEIFSGDFLPGLYHAMAQRGAAFNPSYIDLAWRDDFDRFLIFLRNNSSVKIYYERSDRLPFGPINREAGKTVTALLQCCYTPAETNGSMTLLGKTDDGECDACLEKRGVKMPREDRRNDR